MRGSVAAGNARCASSFACWRMTGPPASADDRRSSLVPSLCLSAPQFEPQQRTVGHPRTAMRRRGPRGQPVDHARFQTCPSATSQIVLALAILAACHGRASQAHGVGNAADQPRQSHPLLLSAPARPANLSGVSIACTPCAAGVTPVAIVLHALAGSPAVPPCEQGAAPAEREAEPRECRTELIYVFRSNRRWRPAGRGGLARRRSAAAVPVRPGVARRGEDQ